MLTCYIFLGLPSSRFLRRLRDRRTTRHRVKGEARAQLLWLSPHGRDYARDYNKYDKRTVNECKLHHRLVDEFSRKLQNFRFVLFRNSSPQFLSGNCFAQAAACRTVSCANKNFGPTKIYHIPVDPLSSIYSRTCTHDLHYWIYGFNIVNIGARVILYNRDWR